MPIEVEVPELGILEFPDDTTETEINQSIDDQLASLKKPEKPKIGFPSFLKEKEPSFESLVTELDESGRPIPSVLPRRMTEFDFPETGFAEREREKAELAARRYAIQERGPSVTIPEIFSGAIPGFVGAAAAGAAKGISGYGTIAAMSPSPETLGLEPGVFAPQTIEQYEESIKRARRTPSEVMRDIQQSPIFQFGEEQAKLAEEYWKVPEVAQGRLATGAAQTVGGLVPYMIVPHAAPALIGLQEIGNDITATYEAALQEGRSEDEAAAEAMNSAMLKGGAQAAIFAILPTPLRKAGDKFLLDKLGPERVKQFIARRIAQVGEGAALGAASGAVSGQPMEGAIGMATLLGFTPRGITPKQQEARVAQREAIVDMLVRSQLTKPAEPKQAAPAVAPAAAPVEPAKKAWDAQKPLEQVNASSDANVAGGKMDLTGWAFSGDWFKTEKQGLARKVVSPDGKNQAFVFYKTLEPLSVKSLIENMAPAPAVHPTVEAIRKKSEQVIAKKEAQAKSAGVSDVDSFIEEGKKPGLPALNSTIAERVGLNTKTLDELKRILAFKLSLPKTMETMFTSGFAREVIESATGLSGMGDAIRAKGITEIPLDATKNPEVAKWVRENSKDIWTGADTTSILKDVPDIAPKAEAKPTPAPVVSPTGEPLNKYGVTESQWREMAGYNDAEQKARWGTTMDELRAKQEQAPAQAQPAPEAEPPAVEPPKTELSKKIEKAQEQIDDFVLNDNKRGLVAAIKRAFKNGLITERSFNESMRVAKDRDMGAEDVAGNVEWIKPEPAKAPAVTAEPTPAAEPPTAAPATTAAPAAGIPATAPKPVKPPQTIAELKEQLLVASGGDLKPEQTDALTALVEGVASYRGMTPDQYVQSRFGGVIPGGEPAADALYSRAWSSAKEKTGELRYQGAMDAMKEYLESEPMGRDADDYFERMIRFMDEAATPRVGEVALRPNMKTLMSLDVSANCPLREAGTPCLECYVEQPRTKQEIGIPAPLTPNKVYDAAPLGDQILNMPQAMVNFVNQKMGGLRVFSTGDFKKSDIPTLDKAVRDAKKRGLILKIITKQPEALARYGKEKHVRFNLSVDWVNTNEIVQTARARLIDGGMPPVQAFKITEKMRTVLDDPAARKMVSFGWDMKQALAARAKNPRVAIRTVAMNRADAIRSIADPRFDVVTMYHGATDPQLLQRMWRKSNPALVENLGPDVVKALSAALEQPKVQKLAGNITQAELDSVLGKGKMSVKDFVRKAEQKFCCLSGRCYSCEVKCGYGSDSPRILGKLLDGEPLASVEFDADSRAIIRGFKSVNVAVMSHELGHVFRRDLRPEDATIVEKWAGVVGAGTAEAKWTVAAEEKFANAFQNYLRSGKPPTPKMAGIFAQFKTWLTDIYKNLKGVFSKDKVSPQIRKVFDRLVGGEEMRKAEPTPGMGAAPPGPGAASPSEFAQRQAGGTRVPPGGGGGGGNPPVVVEGDSTPDPKIVRKNRDYTIWNRINSGQWAFYFGRLGEAAKQAWEKMALTEFRMRESIQRDVDAIVVSPLKNLPRSMRKEGGKAFFEVLDGKTMEEIEAEWGGRPGGEQIIEQARIVKTRLEQIRTTIRDVKRDSYRTSLMSMKKADLEDLYRKNIHPDTMGKTKEQLSDALTMDQFPDDWGIADGSYLPHLFMGQWKVTAKLPGENESSFVLRAQTAAEAKAKIFELNKNFPDAYKGADWVVTQESVIPADMIRLGDRRFWQMIGKMKEESMGAFDPKEAVAGIIGRKSTKQKWFGSLQQRMGFGGYTRNYETAMKAYLSGFHRWHELSALNKEVVPLIEQVKREGRVNAERRLTELLENLWGKPAQVTSEFDAFIRKVPVLRDRVKPLALDRWSRFATSLVSNLTLNTARFALINRLQPLQGLYPLIGEKLLIQAKIMQHTAEGRKLLEEAGVKFDPGQYAGEIAGRNVVVRALERIRGERSNLELAFLGMYLHGRKLGMGKESAIRYGKLRGQLMTQFTPMIVDTPALMEGPVGRVLFQFKRFPVKQIELMARMAADGNLPAIGRLMLTFATMGGLAWLMRQTYSDYDKRYALQRKLRKAVGDKAADVIYYGLPGFVGADLSGSLVLGDEPFGSNIYEKSGRQLAGPGPSLGIELARAAMTEPRRPISDGEKALILAKKIPSMRVITEFIDLARGNTDVLSPDGEIKYKRAANDVLFGLGAFRSANESNIQIARNAIMELEKDIARLKNRAWVAKESRDEDAIDSVQREIEAFNQLWPEAAIKQKQLNDYFKYRRREDKETEVERAAGKRFKKLLPRTTD